MSKLTLPIVADKKYVRRDGKVITAELPDVSSEVDTTGSIFSVGNKFSLDFDDHVFALTGRVFYGDEPKHQPNDLVADYVEEVNPTRHPHYENMLQYAEDSLTTTEAWQNWEYFHKNKKGWRSCTTTPSWVIHLDYRRKPVVSKDELTWEEIDSLLNKNVSLEKLISGDYENSKDFTKQLNLFLKEANKILETRE